MFGETAYTMKNAKRHQTYSEGVGAAIRALCDPNRDPFTERAAVDYLRRMARIADIGRKLSDDAIDAALGNTKTADR